MNQIFLQTESILYKLVKLFKIKNEHAKTNMQNNFYFTNYMTNTYTEDN